MAFSLDTEGPQAVQPLINKLGIQFPIYWVGTPAVQHYQIMGVPTTMVYNNGRLVEKFPGSHSEKFIEKKIEALVAAANS
jgi:hypothetical protein